VRAEDLDPLPLILADVVQVDLVETQLGVLVQPGEPARSAAWTASSSADGCTCSWDA
jgi:hypothetical protein